MSYFEKRGNIFNTKAMAVVNTVNCVGVMGKGIALEFKLRYPEMFKEYQKVCFKKSHKPGQILPYRKSTPWILNFAIKNDWKDPSKEEWIEETLSKFCNTYKQLGITSIAFPWMGAMNGGLPIETIKSLTRKYLQNLDDIDIEIYDFDTSVADPLYNNLLSLKDSDIGVLSDKSNIQKRYWEKVISLLNQNKTHSLHELCNYKVNDKRVIGKTNIERLFHFLSDKEVIKELERNTSKIKLI
jgi:O-acetyl-ADP-ribose deacetylase (regulator of RNase III)